MFGAWFWYTSITTNSVAISFVESATTEDGWFTFAILNMTLPIFFFTLASFCIELPLILVQSLFPKWLKIIYKIILFALACFFVYCLVSFMCAKTDGQGGKIAVGIIMGIVGVIFFSPLFVAVISSDVKGTLGFGLATSSLFLLFIFILATAMFVLSAHTLLGLLILLLALAILGFDGTMVVVAIIHIK
jgi:hypothetical protein